MINTFWLLATKQTLESSKNSGKKRRPIFLGRLFYNLLIFLLSADEVDLLGLNSIYTKTTKWFVSPVGFIRIIRLSKLFNCNCSYIFFVLGYILMYLGVRLSTKMRNVGKTEMPGKMATFRLTKCHHTDLHVLDFESQNTLLNTCK